MRIKKKIFVSMLLCFLIAQIPLSVCASSFELATYTPSEEIRQSLIQTTNLRTVTDDSYQENLFCFDVDQSGNYVLGFGFGSNCRAYVYTKEGEFLYGFIFDVVGTHTLELCEDGLMIFHFRSRTFTKYNSEGICVDVQTAIVNSAEDIAYLNNYVSKTSEKVLQNTYRMERDVNVGSYYSRFVVTDTEGNETVLYNDRTGHYAEIVLFILSAGFMILVVIGAVKKKLNDEADEI